jgi:hypothetical protein
VPALPLAPPLAPPAAPPVPAEPDVPAPPPVVTAPPWPALPGAPPVAPPAPAVPPMPPVVATVPPVALVPPVLTVPPVAALPPLAPPVAAPPEPPVGDGLGVVSSELHATKAAAIRPKRAGAAKQEDTEMRPERPPQTGPRQPHSMCCFTAAAARRATPRIGWIRSDCVSSQRPSKSLPRMISPRSASDPTSVCARSGSARAVAPCASVASAAAHRGSGEHRGPAGRGYETHARVQLPLLAAHRRA